MPFRSHRKALRLKPRFEGAAIEHLENRWLLARFVVEGAPAITDDPPNSHAQFAVDTSSPPGFVRLGLSVSGSIPATGSGYTASSLSVVGPITVRVMPSDPSEKLGEAVHVSINSPPSGGLSGNPGGGYGSFSSHFALHLSCDFGNGSVPLKSETSDYSSEDPYGTVMFETKTADFMTKLGDPFTIDTDFEAVTVGTGSLGVSGGMVALAVVEPGATTLDLAATSLTWDTAQGGVDYGYTISGSDLPQTTTAALYWSTDTSFNTGQHSLIPKSVITTATKAQTTPYTGHIDAAKIGTPPNDAAYKYLLFVVNPDDKVTESDGPTLNDQNNVQSLVLPDIVPVSLTWNDTLGGADFTYRIDGASLPVDTVISLYWGSASLSAQGVTTSPIGDPVYTYEIKTPADRAVGSHGPFHIAPTVLGLPPRRATVLIAVADPKSDVVESKKTNNEVYWVHNLAGAAWFNAYAAAWPESRSLDTLQRSFRIKFERFRNALISAKAVPGEMFTYRPLARAYLMHWSWMIVHGDTRPKKGDHKPVRASTIPPFPGVNIRWDYADESLSTQAASQMISLFDMANFAALNSRHTQGLAVDMQVTWHGTLRISDASRGKIPIRSGPHNANNQQLAKVARTYLVYRNFADHAPHWSSDGL